MARNAMTRRGFMAAAFGGTSLAALSLTAGQGRATETFEFTLTEAQWRERLTEDQFYILRESGTERAFTSELLNEKRSGVFSCVGCDQPLYDSKTKYKSGTGWPSFYDSIEGAVGTRSDWSFFMRRTELFCSRCGGHLGHVFNDGPPPTGMRHCINGIALKFTAM